MPTTGHICFDWNKDAVQVVHVQTALTNMFAHIVLRIFPSSTIFINQSSTHTTRRLREKEEADRNIHGNNELSNPIGIS